MTSKAKSVQIVEVTWKIPNFLQNASKKNPNDFTKKFFVGGGGSAADLRNSFLIKLGEKSSKIWSLIITTAYGPQRLSATPLHGKLMELKIMRSGDTLKELSVIKREPLDLHEWRLWDKLFDLADAESHLDKDDGSLTINFKMEVTFTIPKPNAANMLAGGVAELSNDFESLLKEPGNADVELRVTMGRGRNFQCHKFILAARSPVLRAMFSSDMKEAKANVVEVDDILPKTMEHFLSFIYCGRFQDSSWIQSLPQLAYAADKYCVDSLKEVCDLHLMECVTSRNALALGKLAERLGLIKSALRIREFMARKAKTVTLDTEVDFRDENFEVRYSLPDSSTKTAKETETQNGERTT